MNFACYNTKCNQYRTEVGHYGFRAQVGSLFGYPAVPDTCVLCKQGLYAVVHNDNDCEQFVGLNLAKLVIGQQAKIGEQAFAGCIKLTSVVIDPQAKIGKWAFADCTGLTSVVIGPQAEIGEYAFASVEGLKSVVIGQQAKIGYSAFTSCRGLKSVDIHPEAELGQKAFSCCGGLKSVVLSERVAVGLNAFECCANLTSLVIGSGATIGNFAFRACSDLALVEIHPEATVGVAVFTDCKKLASVVIGAGANIGEGVNIGEGPIIGAPIEAPHISGMTFHECIGLTSVIIGPRATIQQAAFAKCLSLTSVVIGFQAEIARAAFVGCKNLTSVVIHQGVTIGEGAFNDCTGLTSMYVMCGDESEQATWSTRNPQLAHRYRVTFIQERRILDVINKVKVHLPEKFLEVPVFPSNILPLLVASSSQAGQSQRQALPEAPLNIHYKDSSGLKHNNYLALRQQLTSEVRSKIHERFINLVWTHKRINANRQNEGAVIGVEIPFEVWALILSYLCYQTVGADNLVMGMQSLLTPGTLGRTRKGELKFHLQK